MFRTLPKYSEEVNNPLFQHTRKDFEKYLSVCHDPVFEDLYNYIDPDKLYDVWHQLLQDGEYVRPDVLTRAVVWTLDTEIKNICDDLPDYMFKDFSSTFSEKLTILVK